MTDWDYGTIPSAMDHFFRHPARTRGSSLCRTTALQGATSLLLLKGKRELGIKSLQRLRQLPVDDIYILKEATACDAAIEHQRSTVGLGFLQPFQTVASDRKVMYRFFLGGGLFFWQNASGINAINYYSPTIF